MSISEAIKFAKEVERARIAAQLEADADMCSNVNVANQIRHCAKAVRSNIPNSFTDSDHCTRIASGQHRWVDVCAECGAHREEVAENPEQIKDNDLYWDHLTTVGRLETRIAELEKAIKERK